MTIETERPATTWCVVEWCPAEADLYVEGGPLWWPACAGHRAIVSAAYYGAGPDRHGHPRK